MQSKIMLASVLICAALSAPSASMAVEVPSCPVVDPQTGAVPRLSPGRIGAVTTNAEDAVPVPADIVVPALEIVGHFESGGGDPWANVNDTDEISIGYLQWNWNAGSLPGFFGGLGAEEIAAAPRVLRTDLIRFHDAAVAGDRRTMRGILDSWKSGAEGDPVRRGLRVSVARDLSEWLGTKLMRAYQARMVEPKMRLAYSFARKWKEDTKDNEADLTHLTAYFFDLQVYNGGRKGLWLPHVTALRSQIGDDKAVVKFVADWLLKCADFVFDGNVLNKRMYGREDARRNAAHWAQRSRIHSFSRSQVDLLLLGFLRASISDGRDAPRGFAGIFEADVVNRRGVLALGSGYVHSDQLIRLW